MRTETNAEGETLMWLETPFEVEFMWHFRKLSKARQRKLVTLVERVKSGGVDAVALPKMTPKALRAFVDSMPEALV